MYFFFLFFPSCLSCIFSFRFRSTCPILFFVSLVIILLCDPLLYSSSYSVYFRCRFIILTSVQSIYWIFSTCSSDPLYYLFSLIILSSPPSWIFLTLLYCVILITPDSFVLSYYYPTVVISLPYSFNSFLYSYLYTCFSHDFLYYSCVIFFLF